MFDYSAQQTTNAHTFPNYISKNSPKHLPQQYGKKKDDKKLKKKKKNDQGSSGLDRELRERPGQIPTR